MLVWGYENNIRECCQDKGKVQANMKRRELARVGEKNPLVCWKGDWPPTVKACPRHAENWSLILQNF